ncbi:uncharacterized protein LOC117175208 [Belonocnema kinseyi]|uniref:uncharacterized protein LOC117175208 n=1 Tax=Belonocnema kinseyi TaxID=2817044 RepID=UPI00143D059F|nr:uncharacterized protein LOC117175208 [Belonocnema kinseyi]
MKLIGIIFFTVLIFLNSIELSSQAWWKKKKRIYAAEKVYRFSEVYAYHLEELTKLKGNYTGGVLDGILFGAVRSEDHLMHKIYDAQDEAMTICVKSGRRSRLTIKQIQKFPFAAEPDESFSLPVIFE